MFGKKRPELLIQLEDLPAEITQIRIKSLTAPGGLAFENATYGGESWSYQSHGKAVQTGPEARSLPVKEGTVNVTLQATQAMVISFLR